MSKQPLLETLFRQAKTPSITAPHNRESWECVKKELAGGSAPLSALLDACKHHAHPSGATGFLSYCISNGWLVEASAQKIDPNSTGIYLAYPTTAELKPIYPGAKTYVNDRHTKVGIADRSFRARESEYVRTFDGEVVFECLIAVQSDELKEVENFVLNRIKTEYSRVGRAREWFDTTDRQRISRMAREAFEDWAGISK